MTDVFETTETTPDTLRAALEKAADARAILEHANAEMERLEARARLYVNEEKGEDGKLRYSNDKARDAAAVLDCRADVEWNKAYGQAADAKKTIAYAEAAAEAAKYSLRLQIATLGAER